MNIIFTMLKVLLFLASYVIVLKKWNIMNKLLIIASAITILFLSNLVQAKGDAKAGNEKSGTCSACHGTKGISPTDLYPNLAGQHASYLKKQLLDYKTSVRKNPIMFSFARSLSTQDIADLAAYYSMQDAALYSVASGIVDAGQKLYMGGDKSRGITACSACHGPRGAGLALAKFPKISGQSPAYIKTQLESFRSAARNNAPNNMMSDVSAKLTDKDISLLSKYISALH